jgi:integrase
MKFTDKGISNLKGADKKRYVRDVRQGFALRIMPSGIRTFLYIYTEKGTGNRKELNLGNYPEVTLSTALEKYQEAHNKFKNGIDPKYVEPGPTPPEHNTFMHYSDLYLADLKSRYTADGYKIHKYSLDNDVLKLWGDRPLIDITRPEAILLIEHVATRSPGQANNVIRVIRGVFQYAVDRGVKEYNPMLRLSAAVKAAVYKPRKRNLSNDELKALWPVLPVHIKLVLVTAQRPGEVAGMHAKEIRKGVDRPQCLECKAPCYTWTVPAERVKNREAHLVYLTPLALELIGLSDTFVFPSPKPDRPIHRSALAKYVQRHKYFNLPEWHPHDLRRTARTIMSRIGIPGEHAEAVLGHAKQGMTKTYDQHDYRDERAEALIKWETELLRIVS